MFRLWLDTAEKLHCPQLLKTTIFILCSSNSKEQENSYNCTKKQKNSENNNRPTIKTKREGREIRKKKQ